jgi:hypothetical protein
MVFPLLSEQEPMVIWDRMNSAELQRLVQAAALVPAVEQFAAEKSPAAVAALEQVRALARFAEPGEQARVRAVPEAQSEWCQRSDRPNYRGLEIEEKRQLDSVTRAAPLLEAVKSPAAVSRMAISTPAVLAVSVSERVLVPLAPSEYLPTEEWWVVSLPRLPLAKAR